MPDGFDQIAFGLVPGAGPKVKLGDDVGLLVEEVRLQDVAEEVVIAVPVATVVQRDEEQVRSLQPCEPCLAGGLPGDGVAQRPGESIEDRRPQ